MSLQPTPSEPTLSPAPTDREAFWHGLWETERGALFGFLRRRLGDAETAEDLLQETFVRAIRSDRLEAGPGARSYLFTVAQNLAADHLRSRFRLLPATAAGGAGGDGEELDPLAEIADPRAESPEAAVVRRTLRRRVSEALAALPERYRAAFRLAAIEQRSYREIAESTGWSLDQVRVNVHRARRKLIDQLGPELVAEIRS